MVRVAKEPTQYYKANEDVEKMARDIIVKYHPELVNLKIAYIFKNKSIKSRGRECNAQISKVSPKVQAICEVDFVVTLSAPRWQELNEIQHSALLDHELSHILITENESTGEEKRQMVCHDVEEFLSVIRRWGLTVLDLEMLGKAVRDTDLCSKPCQYGS